MKYIFVALIISCTMLYAQLSIVEKRCQRQSSLFDEWQPIVENYKLTRR